MPGTINMIAPEGGVHAVPEAEVEAARKAGWKVESGPAATGRLVEEEREAAYGGLGGAIAASVAGVARGASLGTSDLVASVLGSQGDVDALRELREVNPTTSLVSELGGAVVPSLLSGGAGAAGAVARATPAGAVSALATRVAAPASEAIGLGARVARGVAGGAIEGAAGGAGSYLTEVALEDKPLAAEGFAAAMGKGALWGGAAGGALSLSERALTSARSLFPKQQITREAADEAEGAFTRELGETLRDSDELQRRAGQQVEIATERAMTNPEARAAILAARMRKEQAAAGLAEQRLATAKAREAERAAKAAAGPAPRGRGKKAAAGMTDEAAAVAKQEIGADLAAMEAANAAKVAPPAPASAQSELEAALLGTKARLDAGEDLASVSSRKAAAQVDNEIAEIVAAADPAAAPVVRAAAAERMARAEVDDWIASMRKRADAKAAKTGMSTGYRNTLEAGPFGGASRKTDKLNLPVGPEDAAAAAKRAADDAYFDARNARFGAMDDAALLADREAKQASYVAGKANRKKGGPPTLATLEAPPTPGESVADAAAAALRGRVDVDAEDLSEGIRVLGNMEAATADLVDAVGDVAPPGAIARAAGYREAVAGGNERALAGAVDAGVAAKKELAGPSAAIASGAAQPGTFASALKTVGDIGGALELMQSLGIPGVPDIDRIPVLGPVLSWFLKARAAGAAYRKLFGRGTMPQTAEGAIASRSARSRERAMAAIDKLFEAGAKGAAASQKGAPKVAAMLGHRLFDSDSKDDSGDDAVKAYQARMAELGRAQRPGAVADAVRRRVRTSDPALLAELVATQERKLAYVASKAPKRPTPPTMIAGGRSTWIPSKAELSSFGRIVSAVDDPIGTLERMADGGEITIDAAQAIRSVYPKLFAEAQARIVERVSDPDAAPLPYTRRIQLSILFDVPLDGTMSPNYIEYLQSGYTPPAAAPTGAPPGAPPVPGIAADLSSVAQAATSPLDARAGV